MKLKRFNFRSRPKPPKAGNLSSLPTRLHVLLWITVALMGMLVIRLFYMQIIHGNYYRSAVRSSNTTTRTANVQRGLIYDANRHALVRNDAQRSITYTRNSGTSSQDVYRLANRLSKYLQVDTDNLSLVDQRAYYLADPAHYRAILKLVHPAESTTSAQQYQLAMKYLKQHSKQYQLSAAEKNRAKLYAMMNSSYTLSTTILKRDDVTDDEIAQIGEHISQLPGIKVGTAWRRDYQSDAVKSLTGTVSTNGLPSDELKSLLAQGYARNDTVGISLLEKQYQGVLAGTKATTTITTNGQRVTKERVKYPGKAGDSLVLTIDYQFQQKVQQILEQHYGAAGIAYSHGAYAVVMNPNTGAVYALAGIDRNPKTGDQTLDTTGAITQSMTMGSVVKGATVLAGLMEKVITPENNTLYDSPIKVAGTPAKSSWFNKSGKSSIPLTAAQALGYSSNSYMMQIVMKIAGFDYHPGAQLSMNPDIFVKMRKYYNMFGLGVPTGIDLPNEARGLEGASGQANIGSALDLSYGNYDQYTVMQLAQYMSTIANDGKRMQPYLVQQIRQTTATGGLGAVVATTKPKVQANLPIPQSYFDVVHDGLYQVTHGTSSNTTARQLAGVSPSVSGKTGTAETFSEGHETTTLSFAGYAPSDKPQVVVALAIDGATNDNSGANIDMAKDIFNAYWDMVKARN